VYRLTYNDDVAIICETAHQIPFLLDLGKIVKQSSLSEFRPIARKLRKHRDYGFPFHSGYRSSDRDLEGAGPSAPKEPDGTMFFSRGCKGLQPSRSIASKPAEGKISIWMRKRKRGAWRLPVKGKGLSPVYSQPARSAHPAGSPLFGSKINRCAGCRVSKSNILTSEPASASKELLPIAPRSQLSSMNHRTEV